MIESLPRSFKIHFVALLSISTLTIINLFISVVGLYGAALAFSIIFSICSLLLIFIFTIVTGSNYRVVENPRDPESPSATLIDCILSKSRMYSSIPDGHAIEVNRG
ncbi:hypothetical protein CONCODRAFT_8164 [Conidiobolus coronatus NRRL 28638]|uniref:Uncharacterized protein n=1 Tax=Conidiobolus coronatus (strain ATCC 28846 / CBS 209.66 / NRRL 28638) TaxID=796925 RepID=A0A137P331_CONC2|nr:hypothetical protein CONCODRAFT_8164 [Conidiobolus coronatus NRRL 28638]|eukprot:KXN69430.1 hypothetical protein CONCODRAFT_8164 [Conidiobolus coronatus NRRL 28638]